MSDALRIPLSRLTELLGGLGLDPVDSVVKSVHVEGGSVEVVRYRLDEGGNNYVVGHVPATETVVIGIEP